MRLRATATERKARNADEEQKPARRFRGSRPARGREGTVAARELIAGEVGNRTADIVRIRCNADRRRRLHRIGCELEALRLKRLDFAIDRGRAD